MSVVFVATSSLAPPDVGALFEMRLARSLDGAGVAVARRAGRRCGRGGRPAIRQLVGVLAAAGKRAFALVGRAEDRLQALAMIGGRRCGRRSWARALIRRRTLASGGCRWLSRGGRSIAVRCGGRFSGRRGG